ncbi:hypothetical protein M422DRAFT_28897 [Sphaerobolus stellatus SS14]|nr:hypothetical protein M422DRAFT_28897 [Sphaerobolus stellatus SS14]
MVHPELGPISIICSTLALVALPAQIRARSIPTIALSLWLFVAAFTRGINAIVWSSNVDIKLLVWCDITTRIHHAFVYGVPGAALCIMIQLESIASTRAARMTIQDKRRRKMIEVFMCFILPLLMIVIYYIDEGHRFDIYEGLGCYPTYYGSWVSVIFTWLAPLFMSLISLALGSKVLYHFIRHRITFMQYLNTCPSSISMSRYVRLMALSSIEVFWEIAANVYVIHYDLATFGIRPYVSWDFVHFGFSRVGQFPRFLLLDSQFQAVLIQWWIIPAACMAFFLFFGTGEEAMKDYATVGNWIKKYIFRQTIVPKHSQFGSLPSYSTSSRGTVQTAVSPMHDKYSRDGRKPWDDIEINLPEFKDPESPTDSLAPSYKKDPTVPMPITVTITPVAEDETEPSINTSRFSTGSDLGIAISEISTDSRPEWPPSPSSPTAPAQLAPSRFASASAGGIRVTIEKDSDDIV